jgi:ABC-type transport system involved in cytochrome bd biosynthesis fused ATPase/permease subunit
MYDTITNKHKTILLSSTIKNYWNVIEHVYKPIIVPYTRALPHLITTKYLLKFYQSQNGIQTVGYILLLIIIISIITLIFIHIVNQPMMTQSNGYLSILIESIIYKTNIITNKEDLNIMY